MPMPDSGHLTQISSPLWLVAHVPDRGVGACNSSANLESSFVREPGGGFWKFLVLKPSANGYRISCRREAGRASTARLPFSTIGR